MTPLDHAKALYAEAGRELAQYNGCNGTPEAYTLAGLLVAFHLGETSTTDLQIGRLSLALKVPDGMLRNFYHGPLLRAVDTALTAAAAQHAHAA